MENEKRKNKQMDKAKYTNKLSLRKGTLGQKILRMVNEYEVIPEKNIYNCLAENSRSIVYRTIMRLKHEDYIERVKSVDGEYLLRCKKNTEEAEKEYLKTNRMTRYGHISIGQMMYDESIPYNEMGEPKEGTIYESKKKIIERFPGSEKVLDVSRFIGVYNHYGEPIPVFKLGKSMYWKEITEKQVREYLSWQIYKKYISKAIFLIDDYENEGMNLVLQPEYDKRNYGKALRDSLELSSCYKEAYLFKVDADGIEQLRLFRSEEKIQDWYISQMQLDEIEDPNQKELYDGKIDDVPCIVLFDSDVIRLKRIRRMLDAKVIFQLAIVCYDFQERFLSEALSPWKENIAFYILSLQDMLDDGGED